MSIILPLQFLQNADQVVSSLPRQLEAVGEKIYWPVATLLVLGLILIALGKRLNTTLLKDKFLLFIKPQSFGERIVNDGWVSFLLNVNFLITFWVCLYLAANVLFENVSLAISFSLLAFTVGFYAYQQLGIIIGGMLTGELSSLKVVVQMTNQGLQLVGILLFIIGVFWMLNPNFNSEFFYTFFALIFVYLMVRLFRGISTSIQLGFSWYYIILYFCTLEILPIMFTYYYMMEN